MAAPAFRAASTSETGNTDGTCSLAYPSGIQANDILLLAAIYECPVDMDGYIDVPSGFSTYVGSTYAQGRFALFWKRAAGTESGTLNMTSTGLDTGNDTCYFAAMVAYSGVSTSDPAWDAIAQTVEDTQSTFDVASVTVSGSERTLVIGFVMNDNTGISTPPTSYTNRKAATTTAGTDARVEFYDYANQSSSSAKTIVAAAAEDGVTWHISLKPTGASTYAASGTANATAGASGAITATHVVSGVAAATAGASGAIYLTKSVSGVVAGTSLASGQVVRTTAAAGVVAATSGINGAVFKKYSVSGAVAGTSSATASVTATHVITGTVAGTAGANASVTATHVVTGTVSATTGASGAATVAPEPVSGTVAGTSGVSGAVTATHVVTGVVSAVAGAVGAVTVAPKAVSGVVAGTSGASGAVTATHVITGTAAATSGASGAIFKKYAVSGVVNSVTSANGDVTKVSGGSFPASGVVAATSGAVGEVTATHVITGAAPAVAGASAAVTATHVVTGTVAGTSSVSGAVTAERVVSGAAAATSGLSGAVTATHVVSAVNSAVSGTNLAVTAIKPCTGTVSGVSATNGNVTISGAAQEVSGTVNATTSVSGWAKLGYFSFLTGLQEGTHYFVRAYATNSQGTSYGQGEEFVTDAEHMYVTGTVNAVSGSSANLLLHYISHLTALADDEHYYVRAYATNSSGTSYGDVEQFDTGTGKDVSGTVTVVSGASANVGLESTFKGLMGLLFPPNDPSTLAASGTVSASSGASCAVTATHVVSGVANAVSTFSGIVAFIPVPKGFLGLMGLLLISSEPLPKEAVGSVHATAGASMSVTATHEVAGAVSAFTDSHASVTATAVQHYPPDIVMRAYLIDSTWDFDGTIESTWGFSVEDRVFTAEEGPNEWTGTLQHE